jgi:hypothetical protein
MNINSSALIVCYSLHSCVTFSIRARYDELSFVRADERPESPLTFRGITGWSACRAGGSACSEGDFSRRFDDLPQHSRDSLRDSLSRS